MSRRRSVHFAPLLGFALLAGALSHDALASTVTQNTSWTIDRAGTTTKFRVTAYGDSIYAGYNTSLYNIALFAAPTVDADYLQNKWNADMEIHRRTKSGAIASGVYNEKIVNERVRSVTVANGAVHITFGNTASKALQGHVLTVRPAGVPDARIVPLVWLCGGAGAPDKMQVQGEDRTSVAAGLLPARCR